MCMTFLRYQEFYESPSPKFRGQFFTLLEYMDWYCHKYGGGAFTYPKDWAGFNIPGEVVPKIWDHGILDRNIYDHKMKMVHEKCLESYPDGKFYLIGAVGTKGAMKHEIAHGFFYTRPDYKQEMSKLVKSLKPSLKKNINKVLKDIGYTPKVYTDETQAYLSTGVPKGFKLSLKKESLPFIEVFNRFYKE